MLYTKSDNYDKFICTAGTCPGSCCAGGWQIMIDAAHMDLYASDTGLPELNERLRGGVDRTEECFFQDEKGICRMLDPDGLCSIQRALGEAALCDTCRVYPRHTEVFEDVREYSLSLSCPEAARLILERTEPLAFTEWETEESDDPEEYEDFDFLLYSQLTDARRRIFRTIQDRSISFAEKARRIAAFAEKLQDCVDRGRMFEMDELIYGSEEDTEAANAGLEPAEPETDPFGKNLFSKLFELEMLKPGWLEIIDRTWNAWDPQGAPDSQGAPEIPGPQTAAGVQEPQLSPEEEIMAEQLLMFWIYTYFCGAVYDGWIYSKVMLALCSTWWIFRIRDANSFPGGLIEAAYRYAREIEHSDENLNDLEEWFMERRGMAME